VGEDLWWGVLCHQACSYFSSCAARGELSRQSFRLAPGAERNESTKLSNPNGELRSPQEFQATLQRMFTHISEQMVKSFIGSRHNTERRAIATPPHQKWYLNVVDSSFRRLLRLWGDPVSTSTSPKNLVPILRAIQADPAIEENPGNTSMIENVPTLFSQTKGDFASSVLRGSS
jgi:hypothetical protein